MSVSCRFEARTGRPTAGDPKLAASLGDLAVADRNLIGAGCASRDRTPKLLAGRGGIEALRSNCAVREHRHEVVRDLDESAIYVITLRTGGSANAQLSKTEPADERSATRRYASFAVIKRQSDKARCCVDDRGFGRDDHAAKLTGRSGVVGHSCLCRILA